jgi:hypothetical protein
VRRNDRQPPLSDPSPVRTSRASWSGADRILAGLVLTLAAAAGVAGTATASTTSATATPTTVKSTATSAKAATTTAPTTAKPSTTSTAAKTTTTTKTTKTTAAPTTAPRTTATAAAPTRPATTSTTAAGRTATEVTAKGGTPSNEGATPLTTPGPPALLVEGPVNAISSPKLLSPLTKMWLSALAATLVGLAALTMTVRYWRRTTPTAPARTVASRPATKATAPKRERPAVPDLVDPTIALRRPTTHAAFPRGTGETWEHHHLPT